MKLLVVSSWCPWPPDNGAKQRAYHLLEGLAKRHQVTLLTFCEDSEDGIVAELRRLCARVETVPGNPFKPRTLRTRDLFSGIPRSYAQTYSETMQRLVDLYIDEHDAAIAFALGTAMYLQHHRQVPRVLEEIEVGVLYDRYHKARGWPRARQGLTWTKYRSFVRRLASQYERATAVSEIERQHLVAIGCAPSSVAVVKNGVDRALLTKANAPRPGRLVYSGAVTYDANLDAVRYFTNDILPLVRRERQDCSFTVTGATGDCDVSGLAAAGATFTGRVADISYVVGHSAVCVVPLRIGGGTRLKILEALALGTPVVSTSKGAEGLDVIDGEHLLLADTPDAFAAAVLRVMNDCVLRARLAANGRRLIERHYTWDRIGDELEQVLQEACAVHRAPGLDERRVAASPSSTTV